MSIAIVPHIDEVDGDLIEAAKPMALLGWTSAAALSPRLALEEAVHDAVDRTGAQRHVPRHPNSHQVARGLERRGVIDNYFKNALSIAYSDLSNVVHGRTSGLFTVAPLVMDAESLLRALLEL